MAVLASDEGGKNFREDLSEKVHPDCHALVIQPGSAPAPKAARKAGRQEQAAETAGLGASDSRDGRRRLPKLRRGQRLGTPQPIFRPANFTASRWMTRSLITASPAACRTTRILPARARCRAKKGSATPIGSRSAAATDFMSRSIRPIREIFYAESQEGYVHRINLRNGERRDLRPEPPEGQERYRFHWNAPLIGSRHKPGVLYLAGNRVFRLTDKGEHFQVISPDLTRNEPERSQRQRERRGKFRRRLFVRRIARQSRRALGRHGRRPSLGDARTTAGTGPN